MNGSTAYILASGKSKGSGQDLSLIADVKTTLNEYADDIYDNKKVIYHEWDFRNSIVDSVTGQEAVLSGCTRDANGLHLTAKTHNAVLENVFRIGRTIEIEVAEANGVFDASKHGRCFMIYRSDLNKSEGLVYRWQSKKWSFYANSSWSEDSDISDKNIFSGKTVKLVSDDNGYVSLYVNGEFLYKSTVKFGEDRTFFSIGGYDDVFYNLTVTKVTVYTEELK